jgi:hypothetical protein
MVVLPLPWQEQEAVHQIVCVNVEPYLFRAPGRCLINPAGAITGSFNDGFTINHGFLQARDGT